MTKTWRRLVYTLAAMALVALLGWLVIEIIHYWPKRLALSPPGTLVAGHWLDGNFVISAQNRVLMGDLADFDDGFFAYLMFDHYRSRAALENREVLLISQEQRQRTTYRILLRLPDNFIDGINELAELKADRLTSDLRYDWVMRDELSNYVHQTSVFRDSYAGPLAGSFERLHGKELQFYLRRFIRFKSLTDPRTHEDIAPIPSPLTRLAASRLAADMIAVSEFYNIPLDLLIGIGAMENNFMDVPGDANNTVWKRHAQPGDIVLERRRGRVRVKDDSTGVWQITKQSLRYAHRLYLEDMRDYTELPDRLRPPKKLDVSNVSQDVLTTYAGLLLRDLLDRFGGNVTLAAGAYNGGPRHPNPAYASGVAMVAAYAQRMIGRAAELNHQAVSETTVDNRSIHHASRLKE
jgi:hypothetical protein